MDIDKVRNSICEVSGVKSVHDLHAWALTSGKSSLTAHVVHDPSRTPEILRDDINAILADRFFVFHTTLQMESVPAVRRISPTAHREAETAKAHRG